MFNSIPGLYLLDGGNTSCCDNQKKCLQTLPNAPWLGGGQNSPIENYRSKMKSEPGRLNLFAMAPIAKWHKSAGLNERNLLSHSFGSWKSKIKVSAGLLLEGSEGKSHPGFSSTFWGFAGYLWHSLADLWLHVHVVFTLCVYLCPNLPYLQNTRYVELGAHPIYV